MKKKLEKNKKKLYVILMLVFIFLKITLNDYSNLFNEPKAQIEEKNDDTEKDVNSKENIEETTELKEISKEEYIYVDIEGAVKNPGLYKVEPNTRIGEVIEKAGGLTHANTQCVNLSKKVSDEEYIYITPNTQKCETVNNNTHDNTEKNNENEENIDKTHININSSSQEELQTLSGIGETKAENIVNYREENGDFKNIEEIKNVSGIGDSTFETIKDEITV